MSKAVCAVVGVGPGTGETLARTMAADGYAVALMARSDTVTGPVAQELVIDTERARTVMPDVPDEGRLHPEAIASTARFLVRQPRSAWTFELDVRPHVEGW